MHQMIDRIFVDSFDYLKPDISSRIDLREEQKEGTILEELHLFQSKAKCMHTYLSLLSQEKKSKKLKKKIRAAYQDC